MNVRIPPINRVKGFGWKKDKVDKNDYTMEHPVVSKVLAAIKKDCAGGPVDNRQWCSDIEDQQQLGSCTANAGTSLVEFYENKITGTYMDGSRLYLYRRTRQLENPDYIQGYIGDTGAELRDTMKALVLYGVCDEAYWPYTDADPAFDNEPPSFCDGFAENFKVLTYYKLDPAKTTPEHVLRNVKHLLCQGGAAMFGFTVYASIFKVSEDGSIPFPGQHDQMAGGHAVLAVGYDDERSIPLSDGSSNTTGAILIKNSWGWSWGDRGYGWLPYEYVLAGLATDWWSVVNEEWVNLPDFE
ncbi:MAG TPA: C1 family peptidase [Candidatus Bathyarchaeia archaeon]|nr:C1 family peptidase [Candidatus Bathyarchaeia archaeon]